MRTFRNSRVGFAECRSARSQRRQTALRRNAGELYGAGRSFCQRFRREYRRRLLRNNGGIYQNAARANRKYFAETTRRASRAVGFFNLFSPALFAGRIVFDRRRACKCVRLEKDARSARSGKLGRTCQSRQIAGKRRRTHSRCQRGFRRARRRCRYARTRFAARYKCENSFDVRFDGMGKNGSGTRTRGGKMSSQFNEFRRRRTAIFESFGIGETIRRGRGHRFD